MRIQLQFWPCTAYQSLTNMLELCSSCCQQLHATAAMCVLCLVVRRMMQVKGEATFNGHVLTKKLKRQVGYVMQVSGPITALCCYCACAMGTSLQGKL